MKWVSSLFRWFITALFPERCIICKKEGKTLCKTHQNFVPQIKNTLNLKHLDEVTSLSTYKDPNTKKVIEYFKFKGFKSLSDFMVQEYAKTLKKDQLITLAPIPLHWSRKFTRGFNQSLLLAESIKKISPANIQINDCLKRKKHTQQQARLKKEQRIKNLEKAFQIKTQKKLPTEIILIDDVVSTGATLENAAKVLKKAGVKKVYAFTFAN